MKPARPPGSRKCQTLGVPRQSRGLTYGVNDWHEYDWMRETNLSEPEDPLDLRIYFAVHPQYYEEIIRVARKHSLKVDHFATLMDPQRTEEAMPEFIQNLRQATRE